VSYSAYNLETIKTISGTLSITLFADTALGDLTAHIPTSNIESIDSVNENVEDKTGVIELNTMDVTIKETYSETYPEGFWYNLINSSVELEAAMPELRFYLDTGAGNTYLFWGRIDPMTARFPEKALTASKNIRLVSFTLIAAVTRLKDVSWASLLSDLKTSRGVTENPTGTPTGLGVTFAGTPGSTTYKYRVAARDANGEYLWSSEATVTNSVPVLNATGDHNILTWTGVALATEYAIYRTYVGGGSLAVGFIGLKGSGGSGTITFNDTGFSGDGVATQSRLSARIFITPMDFFRVALSLAFDQGYVSPSVTYPNEDIRCKIGATPYTLEETYLLLWKNYQTPYDPHAVTLPEMAYAEYFNSDKDQYFGSTYGNVLNATGAIAKNFGFYPRYRYDISGVLHVVDLLTRGRFGSLVTMDGGVMEPSEQDSDTNLSPKTIRAKRSQDKTEAYTPGANDKSRNYPIDDAEYELDQVLPFYIQELFDSTATPTYDYGNDFEQLFAITISGGKTTATRMDGAEYYDYGTLSYVAASGITPLAEAWVKYFRALTHRKRKIFRRRYSAITGTIGGTSSHENLTVLRRTEINDGLSVKTFYATEVRKNLRDKTVEITWVQQ